MRDNKGLRMSTTTKGIDLSTLSNEQLAAEKRIAYQKANDILGASGRVDDERFAEAKQHLADCDILETEMGRRAEIDGMRAKASGGLASLMSQPAAIPFSDNPGESKARRASSVGDAFVKSASYQNALKSGALSAGSILASGRIPEMGVTVPLGYALSRGIGEKGLLYTDSAVGGAWVIPEYEPGFEPKSRPTPDILSLLTVQPTASDTIYWIRQDTRSTAATAVAEATNSTGTTGTKPETSLAFSRQTSPVETLAVWIAATNQQLADASEIAGIINSELVYDLTLQLDNQILNGGGTSPELTGILNASIQSVAYSTATYSNKADTVLRALVVIATANEPAPTGIIMNPVNWETMRILRESGSGSSGSGTYLMGSPMMEAATTLWGLPVVVSNRITSGTALVGNFAVGAKLHLREDATVKVGMANDDFTRNIVRVLAEMRAALTVRRPSAFAKVTSL